MIFTSYKKNNLINSYRSPGLKEIDSFVLQKNEVRTVPFSEQLDYGSSADLKNSNKVLPFTLAISDEYTFKNKPTKQDLFEINSIRYDHIPYINYFKNSKVSVKNFDLKTYNKKIGYIVGAGDKVPEALEQMGYEVTLLTDKELSRNNLQQFDAIITGVRAYNTNDWMNKYYDKLMKYVNDGGNFIVQYNNTQFGPVSQDRTL